MVKQRGTAQGHRLVPGIEEGGIAPILEKAVSLLDRARVGGEDLAVAHVCLGSERVELSPAPRCRPLHEREVVRAEQDGQQRPGEVLPTAGLAVAQEPTLVGRGHKLNVHDAPVPLEPGRDVRLGRAGGEQL